jgi:hypothetical protein
MMPITMALRCFTGYIYSFRLALIAIQHFSTFRSRFSSSFHHSTTMDDMRGIKCSRSPSKEGSSSPSSVSTPLPSPLGSPLPPGSPLEVSSDRLRSPIFEHGGPSERIPVVDLSSDEKDLFPDTLRDEEFTRKLFSDLNRGLLGTPGDDNIIILSISDEDEEVHEEEATDTKAAPPSAVMTLAPTTADAEDASKGVQESACKKRALESLRMLMALHCYTTSSFVKNGWDGDAESLLSLTPFMLPVVSFVSVMSL